MPSVSPETTQTEANNSLPLTTNVNKLPRVISREITKTGRKTVILVEQGVLSEAQTQGLLKYLRRDK